MKKIGDYILYALVAVLFFAVIILFNEQGKQKGAPISRAIDTVNVGNTSFSIDSISKLSTNHYAVYDGADTLPPYIPDAYTVNYDIENYGATGMGDIVLNTGPTITNATINYPAKATGTVVAATGITAAMLSRMMYFNTASAINITADPQIANGTSGQIITIIGSSDTNTLTLDDSAGLRLTGQMILGIGDNITLMYEGTIGDWIELSRSNN